MVVIFADLWDKKGAYFERLVEIPDVNPREIHVDPRANGLNIIATIMIPFARKRASGNTMCHDVQLDDCLVCLS